MKKVIFTIAIIFAGSIVLVSCGEKEAPKETTNTETIIIKEVEVNTESKGALERAAEKVDAEANKKIDKQIDKIGSDN